MRVALLTGGGDKPYALGMVQALVSKGIAVDVIGSDELMAAVPPSEGVTFFNFRENQDPSSPVLHKAARILKYYWRLFRYAGKAKAVVFHVLWANRFVLLDRVLFLSYYKLLGKKVVFTAHNINERERDGGDGVVNRITLRFLYSRVDHVLVHTNKMRAQLVQQFKLPGSKVSIIPFGINNTLPRSDLTRQQARKALQVGDCEKVLLFFGNIAPYKGLEVAISALGHLNTGARDDRFRLVIAGQVKGCLPYWAGLDKLIDELGLRKQVVAKIEYIPDEQVEVFFKAADVLVLPYKFIYQSGVLFLSYSFGLPVIATDVGSLSEDVVEGRTGMMCRPNDPDDLAEKLAMYFESDLFRNLESNRKAISDYGNETYSWDKVGDIARALYSDLSPGH